MKCSYLILFICLGSSGLRAQQRVLSGYVQDAGTRKPVPDAAVHLRGTHTGSTTNTEGRFTLKVPSPAIRAVMVVSRVGYQTDSLAVTYKNEYSIKLKPVPGVLTEVVITGVSKATQARENPIPVIGVSVKAIERTTESNIIDVLVKNVPGLNAVKTGPNISKPFIRGLGYNRVLTLYDGIRQEGQQWGDEHGIEVDAYNIGRAEVVKGPSSLIYGSDAVAGVVGLIPAMPQERDSTLHGKFLSEYQSNNGLIGNGLRLTYGRGNWSYILRGSYRIAKNYINTIDGRVYNTGFRETNASATVKHVSSEGYSSLNFTLYDNLPGIPDGSRDSLTRRFTYQANEGAADDVQNRPLASDAMLNSYRLSPLIQHIQHYRLYTKNHYRLGGGDVDALLAFQQNIRREFNHPTQPDQAGMYLRLNTLNYGLNYNAPAVAGIELSFGLNGMYQSNASQDATDFPVPDYHLFDAGAFGFARWKHERFTLSAGLRYDKRYLSGSDFYTAANPATGFDTRVSGAGVTGVYLQFPAFDKRFGGLSLSAGSTYALSEQISLKANIARGYRAPSITEYAANGLDPGAHIVYLGNRSFKPEFSLQEDLGVDVSNPSFSATLSLFNNHISNYIFLSRLLDADGSSITNAQGNKTYQYQQAKAQLYGLEATFGLHPAALKGFTFNNALALTCGYNRSAAFRGTQQQGEYLPLIPPVHLLSSVSQEIQLQWRTVKAINLKAAADINAAQRRYLALNNTETFTPGYTLVDIGAGAEIQYSKRCTLQVQVQVNNLFDVAYQSHLNRLKYFEYYAASPNGRSGIYSMGRNVCVKVVVPF